MKINKYINRNTLVVVLVLAVCLISTDMHANDLEDILFDTEVDDTGAAPIDGFIGIAMAIGAFVGIKKIRNKKQ